MRVLIVCPLLPYPLTDGGRKGVYYPIKYLTARGHQIHLACLTAEYDTNAVAEMKKFCNVDVVVAPKDPTLFGVLKGLFSTTPYELSRFHNVELLKRIQKLIAANSFDIVQVEGIHSAFYGLEILKATDIPVVMRVHNVHSRNLVRLIDQTMNPILKTYLRYESRKIENYEIRQSPEFDLNLCVSGVDQEVVLSQNPRNQCTVVPAGVDLSEFCPGSSEEEEACSVLWLGGLQWLPNQDSFWWFYKEIVPRIVALETKARISVVGSNAPRSILELQHPNVNILGFVPDVERVLRRAQVCVVPLRAGSGIRLKLLEMFATQKAVVSTSVGCEGLDVKDDEHLLVADTPEDFSDAVIRLLGDANLRQRLSTNALEHVRRHYSWERIAEMYEQAFLSLLGNSAHTAQ